MNTMVENFFDFPIYIHSENEYQFFTIMCAFFSDIQSGNSDFMTNNPEGAFSFAEGLITAMYWLGMINPHDSKMFYEHVFNMLKSSFESCESYNN